MDPNLKMAESNDATTSLGVFSPKTSSVSVKTRMEVFACAVCEDGFGQTGEKIPRLLHCGHTLCHGCLQKLTANDPSLIYCPFDRQVTPVGKTKQLTCGLHSAFIRVKTAKAMIRTRTGPAGVWELKKNFALLELLDRLRVSVARSGTRDQHRWGSKVGSPPPPTDVDQEKTPCGLEKEKEAMVPCDEDEGHIAVLYCVVCSSHLCLLCSDRTHDTRTLARHRRVPLSLKPREKVRCEWHPQHVAEFVCLESECQISPLMCYICRDYGRHHQHKHGLLEAEAENVRSSVHATAQKLRKRADEVTEDLRKLETVLSQLDEGPVSQGEIARGKISDACTECERAISLDDARLVQVAAQLKHLLDNVEAQQLQDCSEEIVRNQQSPVLDASVPITFTKDNRVQIGPKLEMRVVTLGLDDAGKTSLLFKLKQNEFVATIPTIGFNVEVIEYENLKLTIWDVGGQPKLRPLWKHYYLNTQDAANAIPVDELVDALGLYKLCCGRAWHIIGCDAPSGGGLISGLDWLSHQLAGSTSTSSHDQI
ncbi:unnamed protein product [Cyprideis torosa]|uniref:Uncharacterized protein n=1 Tax=Cyprideis torosa TaxID=163714 RepID=A0A7R8ZNR5_9CRUS|nr:unnamed protein product [Cyprideis torosa]CAG0896978.1 unnamed protein product [Cyprideis torosa]